MSLLGGRRRRLAILLAAAIVLGGTLVAASQIGSDSGGDKSAAVRPTPPPAQSTFAGIPQHGIALGSPKAPVTLVEYADFQCPYCAEWTHRTLPFIVDQYVRPGKVRMVFRGLAFLGADSDRALRAAVAAGRQNRLWDVAEALYHRQGGENTGWVTDGLLEEVAGAQALSETSHPWVERQIASADRAAQAAGVPGTPSFEVGPTGGRLQLVELRSVGPEGLTPAIDAALRS